MQLKSANPAKVLWNPLPTGSGLKAKLVGATLVTVTLTAAIIHIPWLLTSRRNIESIISQTNDQITLGVSQKVGSLFDSASTSLGVIENIFANGWVDLNNSIERENFYFNFLEENPAYSFVVFGYSNGNQLAASRDAQGTLRVFFRQWDPGKKISDVSVHQYGLVNGKWVVTKKDTYQEKFFAPDRPWYKVAIDNLQKRVWTDVYMFNTDKVPGINFSLALIEDGKTSGVISIAFELAQISGFLRDIRGKADEIFLMNGKGDLIAFTGDEDGFSLNQDQKSVRLKRLEETDSSYLSMASLALKNKGFSIEQMGERQSLIHQHPSGEKYYITLSPLTEYEELGWHVGTVIPESAYTSEIDQNTRILFFIIAGSTIIAVILAILLTEKVIAQPLSIVAESTSLIESDHFDPDTLSRMINPVLRRQDELGQLARVILQMSNQVYTREKQLKEEVKELRIEIDEAKRQKQVNEIVDSEFFQDLAEKAKTIRRNRDKKDLK
ncbi:MAG: cache domain-containing protein [Cyanobacteriota bacterium]|nr:cache domain-containing protein [Cyanobacteriota bacterium]